MRLRRSTILVPANVDRMVENARGFVADVVLLDLEDAVPAVDTAKERARANMVAALRGGGFRAREISVRVNGPNTKWFEADVLAAVNSGASSITLPHTYGAEDVARAEMAIFAAAMDSPLQILLAVETPATLLELEEIARRSRHVTALCVAPVDFTLAIGSTALLPGVGAIGGTEQLLWLRQKLLTVARAKGWNAIDAAMAPDPRDEASIRNGMTASRALGFDGTGVLYPTHIAVANEVFSPSAKELAWADEVIGRFEKLNEGRAADTSDGKLVMIQHYEFAKGLRALAARIEER